jgi:hypothetical protein
VFQGWLNHRRAEAEILWRPDLSVMAGVKITVCTMSALVFPKVIVKRLPFLGRCCGVLRFPGTKRPSANCKK